MVPPLCVSNIQFLDLDVFARLNVEYTIQEAIDVIKIRNQPKEIASKHLIQDVPNNPVNDSFKSIDESFDSDSSTNIINIHKKLLNEWPNIGMFKKADIEEYIKRFVNKWKLRCDWKYCIHFLCEERNKCSNIFYYDIKWSIPTQQYPIPQVTASVYFKIEVPRCKPKCSPINVSYQFEGSGFVHKPNKMHFNEDWLLEIVNNKIRFISTLRF